MAWIQTSAPWTKTRALELALAQVGPEVAVGLAFDQVGLAEHAVVPALDLAEGVAHGAQEVGVCAEHIALHVELDDCLRQADGVELALGFRRQGHFARDVGGELDDLVGLAGGIQDGVVGGLDPDLLTVLRQPAVAPRVELAAAQALPEGGVLAGAGEIGLAEDAVVLADELLRGVPEAGQKVLVDVQDAAAEVELDHCLHPVDGGNLAFVVGLLAAALGHIGGQLDDPDGAAVGVQQRVVGGLQPDRLATLGQAHEHVFAHFAGAQALPHRRVGLAGHHFGRAEDAVVLAPNFIGRVTHQRQKARVGAQHAAVQIELHHRLHVFQRRHQRGQARHFLLRGKRSRVRSVHGSGSF